MITCIDEDVEPSGGHDASGSQQKVTSNERWEFRATD